MKEWWKNLTSIGKVYYIWIILIVVIAVAMLVAYLRIFHGGFSFNSSDWANASSFFYGILTVLLTALNVFLFYRLTTAANALNEKNKNASDRIIKSFTTSELKQRHFSAGMSLYSQYVQGHSKLVDVLERTDFSKESVASQLCQVGIAAGELQGIYLIIHSKSQIFKQTQAYEGHNDYIDILANLVGEHQHQNNIQNIDDNAVKSHQDYPINKENPIVELTNHFEEVIKLMTADLQKLK